MDDVTVARIVCRAAKKIKGVVATSDKGSHAVKVVENENDTYDITLPVTLEFMTELTHIAQNIQNEVREQVVEATGKKVTRIDVVIKDLKMPDCRNQ